MTEVAENAPRTDRRPPASDSLTRFPLRFVLPAGLFALGVLAAAIVAIASSRMADAQAERFVSELLVTIGNQAGADVSTGLRNNDVGRIRGALEQLQVLRGLESALLLDGNDVVGYATDIDLVGMNTQEVHNARVATAVAEARRNGGSVQIIDGGHLYFANYISGAQPFYLASGDDAHVLLLEYDYSALQAANRSAAMNEALIIVATIILLSVSCWLFLRSALLTRIDSLTSASQRIGTGDLSTPVGVTGGDEIGQLGAAFDRMRLELTDTRAKLSHKTEQLVAAKAAVEEERATLADKVLQRTADLTRSNEELAVAKEAAEAASVAKSAFLATVSHEIRTPMNGVLGAMELLERTGLEGHRAALLKTARESARSLLSLLSDLLDMAKIEAGRIEIESAPAALASIVDSVVATHMPTAIARRNTLSSSVAADVPLWIAVDAMRIQQILGNFVSNAIKYTVEGDIEVIVTSVPAGKNLHRLRFEVRDDGAGISPDVIGKLFRPFQQGPGEHARHTGSTGLGLAICKGLAERMGAKVELQSTPGEGTTAILELDVSAAAPPRASSDRSSALDDTAIIAVTRCNLEQQPGRVLVVDDHPVNRSLQARQLEQLGLIAESAYDGSDALEKLRSAPFDLLITDCEMPRMDGYELARTIRAGNDDIANIPIIACTAHALPEVAKNCMDAGMNAVLTKPMQLRELAQELRRALPTMQRTAVSQEIFDEQQLNMLTGTNEDLRQELVDSFLEDYRKSCVELTLAVERLDHDRCREIAHRNKGACAVFGAIELGEAFAEMETTARNRSAGAAPMQAALERIELAGNRLTDSLISLA
jgi:signal transduction histidine kinase/DNA-binding NarL/FixJ family response regulator